jgi:hypothetical protein
MIDHDECRPERCTGRDIQALLDGHVGAVDTTHDLGVLDGSGEIEVVR